MNQNNQTINLEVNGRVFPSWVLHKVTPITKGKRRVVVGWGEGIIV